MYVYLISAELVSLRESEEKMKQQQSEATRRENVLVMRLTTKEQEMQEYAVGSLHLLSGDYDESLDVSNLNGSNLDLHRIRSRNLSKLKYLEPHCCGLLYWILQ